MSSGERFAIAGHDRGGLVVQRLALEHPEAVSHVAILDIVPVLDMWDFLNADAALSAYHLFFLAQPPDLPERRLAGAPEAFVDSFLDGWRAERSRQGPSAPIRISTSPTGVPAQSAGTQRSCSSPSPRRSSSAA